MAHHDIDDSLPEDFRTLPGIWRRRVEMATDPAFLWYSGRGWTTLDNFQSGLAATRSGLLAHGVAKGDRICILMRNSPEMLQIMLAVWSQGAVAVPLSASLVGSFLEDQIERAEPRLLICDRDFSTALGRFGDILVNAEDLATSQHAELPNVDVGIADAAIILYTSGSTGPSKGCVLSHHFCVYYGWVFWRYMGYRGDDTIYSCLPLNHVHALLASFLPSLMAGGKFAFAEKFSASRYWLDLVEADATTCSAIGPMAAILLRQPPIPEEAQLKVRLAHIAPAPPQVEEFQARFGMKVCSTLFGMSEAMIFPPDPDRAPVTGVIGAAPADWDVAIVDELGRALPAGEPGELVARPRRPLISFDGYYKMPEATADAWRGSWYHTGDVCRCDADGVYWFMGRKKDIIRRRGHNISAWEVETTIARHPAIAEASAVPVPSEEDGEEALLVVARKAPEREIDIDALKLFGQDVLPRFMWPDFIQIWDGELPKTQSGKIDKQAIRRLFVEQAETRMRQAS